MKLYTSPRSPFGRKVLVMAIEKGIKNQIEIINEDLKNKSPELLKLNPLGQIPLLVLENGKGLYDSSVICDYIESLSKEPKLLPKRGNKRYYVLKIAAIADGMAENAIAIFYENLKDESARDAAKIKKNTDTLHRCFKSLEKEAKRLGKDVTLAPIAVGSALGYINFRLKDLNWQAKYKKLDAWFAEFSKRPSMKETQPKD